MAEYDLFSPLNLTFSTWIDFSTLISNKKVSNECQIVFFQTSKISAQKSENHGLLKMLKSLTTDHVAVVKMCFFIPHPFLQPFKRPLNCPLLFILATKRHFRSIINFDFCRLKYPLFVIITSTIKLRLRSNIVFPHRRFCTVHLVAVTALV